MYREWTKPTTKTSTTINRNWLKIYREWTKDSNKTSNITYTKIGYNMYRERTQTDYQNKHQNLNQNGYNNYGGWKKTDYQNNHYNIKQNWLQHVHRIDTKRLPKHALHSKMELVKLCTKH